MIYKKITSDPNSWPTPGQHIKLLLAPIVSKTKLEEWVGAFIKATIEKDGSIRFYIDHLRGNSLCFDTPIAWAATASIDNYWRGIADDLPSANETIEFIGRLQSNKVYSTMCGILHSIELSNGVQTASFYDHGEKYEIVLWRPV